MRTFNSIRNIFVTVGCQFFNILLTFITRKVFLCYLSVEYLGIDGLLSNVLLVFSLFDLGIHTAITYSLYKPLAENDKKRLCALMNYYSKLYNIIGVAVIVCGLCVYPFIQYFVKGVENIEHINEYFLIFLASTSITYFFSYKGTLLVADQKLYIVHIIHYICVFLMKIIQVLVLALTENYFAFLSVMFACNLIEGISVYIKTDMAYPFLKEGKGEKLDLESKKTLLKNTKGVLYPRLGSVIINASDNILISIFLGTALVGYYVNYSVIILALTAVISNIYGPLLPGVANYSIHNQDNSSLFKSLNIVTLSIACVCAVFLFALFNPFIEIWLGKEYLLDSWVVFLIVANFYVYIVRRTVNLFRESLGLFWNDRHKSTIEALLKIVLALVLLQFMGLRGILLASLLATLFSGFWIEAYMLFKNVLQGLHRYYYIEIAKFTAITVLLCSLVCYLGTLLNIENALIKFLVMFGLCAIIPTAFLYLMLRKTHEYEFFRYRISLVVKGFASKF